MPRRPAAYPAAYREQIIALARTGRSASALLRRAAVLKNDLAGLKKLADADPPGLHALLRWIEEVSSVLNKNRNRFRLPPHRLGAFSIRDTPSEASAIASAIAGRQDADFA